MPSKSLVQNLRQPSLHLTFRPHPLSLCCPLLRRASYVHARALPPTLLSRCVGWSPISACRMEYPRHKRLRLPPRLLTRLWPSLPFRFRLRLCLERICSTWPPNSFPSPMCDGPIATLLHGTLGQLLITHHGPSDHHRPGLLSIPLHGYAVARAP